MNESEWKDDQRLKKAIREGEFKYDDRQHTEWFIAMLLLHLRVPMGHQTFESQDKALEAAMKLEVMPRGDTLLGVKKIQEQLWAMHMEIHDLRKERGRESSVDLWCI